MSNLIGGPMVAVSNFFTDEFAVISTNNVDGINDLSTLPDTKNRDSYGKIIRNIIMSSLIFIVIVVWFELLRVWFDSVFNKNTSYADIVPLQFWYTIMVTAIVIILLYIVVRSYQTLKSMSCY